MNSSKDNCFCKQLQLFTSQHHEDKTSESAALAQGRHYVNLTGAIVNRYKLKIRKMINSNYLSMNTNYRLSLKQVDMD